METQDAQEAKTVLVLGGTGKTGRRVVKRLEARGLPVRVGSRSGEPPFDWEDEATWVPALQNVGSVYVSYYPDLAGAGGALIRRVGCREWGRAAGALVRPRRGGGSARR